MGNQAVKPYIIDEVDSDDDICYDTAPETDLHPHDSDLDADLDLSPGNKEDPASGQVTEAEQDGGKHMSVDAKVVSSLVSNVEELLDHLSNHDYQAAHSAATQLKSCGIGIGGNGTVVYLFSSVCMPMLFAHVSTHCSHITLYLHMQACTHSVTHTVHTHTCTHTHVHTHAGICTHTHTHIHTHVRTHACTRTHTHSNTYTHTHTHKHAGHTFSIKIFMVCAWLLHAHMCIGVNPSSFFSFTMVRSRRIMRSTILTAKEICAIKLNVDI